LKVENKKLNISGYRLVLNFQFVIKIKYFVSRLVIWPATD